MLSRKTTSPQRVRICCAVVVKTFADTLMSADADTLCNAEYGQVGDERVNHRNGYRPHRAGSTAMAWPGLP